MVDFLTCAPEGNLSPELPHLLLAHGAGQGMISPFLEKLTALLVARGIFVTRFEFEYMAARRSDGKRRPPSKMDTLLAEYRAAVEELRQQIDQKQPIFIGGKSMGGRAASMIADDLLAEGAISGLVCLGYPFHPPKKTESLRTAHLSDLRTPTLIVQGERDPFGTRAEVEGYDLSPAIRFKWMADGDHDLAPRAKSGFTREGHLASAADATAAFLAEFRRNA
jgi:predicted alpha/beta-hydrolase family hydrolase